MTHPVCTEYQDVVKEGIRFRCHVTRVRSLGGKPFKEFPNSRFMEERYEIRVWGTACSYLNLVKLTADLTYSKLYGNNVQYDEIEFEKPEDQIESTIDLLCAEIWQHPLVCKFRAHARACEGIRLLAIKLRDK